MRMLAAQLIGAKPLLVELAVAKVLQEHVGGGEQPMHGLAVFGLGEIEHDAALAAVEQREEGGAHAAEAAGLVAGRRLDLDHLGAELRQDHAAGRTHHHVGHLDDPHARQAAVPSRSLFSPLRVKSFVTQIKPSGPLGKTLSAGRCIHCCITQMHGGGWPTLLA